MPPVNRVASVKDSDNEATAELPVLDVAAYEATLNEAVEHTETIPTLRAAETVDVMEQTLDHTLEMPALPKVRGAAPTPPVPAAPLPVAPVAEVAPAFPVAAPQITLPPTPPLIEDLRNALAGAERRIVELNERARIADAERGVAIARAQAENAQLRQQLGVQLESLQTAQQRLGARSAQSPGLEDELFARADRIAALEKEFAAQARLLAQRDAALADARRQCEELEVERANLRAGMTRRDQQIAILAADMQARQERESRMSARLTDALAATDPHVPQLRNEISVREDQIRKLTEDLKAAQARITDKDQDLDVAEENIRNLEIEVRDKTAKLTEASVTVEEWRAVIAESQRSILQRDQHIQALEADLQKRMAHPVDTSAQTGEEIALEGPARVLIRSDGNTDFVHVLTRRTRIGRGSDNEIVLDTKHISRYHAVLLAGPAHTAVEDLNSTNGVFVNGKRVARQILKDGDRLTIGRTQFRYNVRG